MIVFARRNVEAVFDDRRRDQNIRLVIDELHHRLFEPWRSVQSRPWIATINARLGHHLL